MYTVTFYSFKGGVGRSMALANVAYILAKAGKRVLVVDFDLEAPGLPSYAAFRYSENKPGVVDYINEYIASGEAPLVDNYISACSFDDVTLWVMPAGVCMSPEYSEKLNAINWKDLYEHKEGFLFIEDMKQQWKIYDNGKGFDYVLIDSRTGYTDVGGVCTRQLPDSVVIMFVPTPQNIEGLSSVVSSIRSEKYPVRERPVRLLFCPSNVPDVDDEAEILHNLLKKAEADLLYKNAAALIQNYQSIELLQQPIAVQSMPQSRLSRQYEMLRESIVSGNIEDREGAILTLRRMRESISNSSFIEDTDSFGIQQKKTEQAEVLTEIRALWPHDGEIAWEMAALANKRLQPEEEIEALTIAISSGVNASNAQIRRAMVYAALGKKDLAISDVEDLLLNGTPKIFSLETARQLISSYEPRRMEKIFKGALQNHNIDENIRVRLLHFLMISKNSLRFVVKYVEDYNSNNGQFKNILVLCYIGLGKYVEAMQIISNSREDLIMDSDINDISDVFNYAIAEWGCCGIPPRDLLERVIELKFLDSRSWDVNALQCFSLCNYVLGNLDAAKKEIEESRSKISSSDFVFSCWKYLYTSGADFKKDLDIMLGVVDKNEEMIPDIVRH